MATLTAAPESSKEHRDAHINSGMEDGLQEAMDLLVAVVTQESAVDQP